jgi:peptidoglycan/LPS O-acetylase OafA/YrhL
MHTDPHTPSAGSSRLHALDALRAYALLLGVVLHASMSFFPGPPVWLVNDSASSTLLSGAFFVIHMLRMPTFFLLAGFMARLSMERRGAGAFFLDRLFRIGLPLVVGWPILFMALMSAAGMPERTTQVFGTLSPTSFPLTHLWFLYLLMLFYPATLLSPLLGRRIGHLAAVFWLRRMLLQPWSPAMLAAPLCLSLYLHPYWFMWFGIPTPDQSLLPTLPALVGYGTAFAFGWLVQPQPGVLDRWGRNWMFQLSVACACTAFCLAQAGVAPLLAPAPQGGAKLAYAAAYSLGAWTWSLALLGMAQRFLSDYNAVRHYLADASYWIYLVHLPLVVSLQALVSNWAWPWLPKFVLVVALVFVIALVTYALVVRRTFVGAVLHGRIHP